MWLGQGKSLALPDSGTRYLKVEKTGGREMMNEQRVADIRLNVIRPANDRELLRASWWMARAEQLLPLVDAEIKLRGI
jgi:hypothetical protein